MMDPVGDRLIASGTTYGRAASRFCSGVISHRNAGRVSWVECGSLGRQFANQKAIVAK